MHFKPKYTSIRIASAVAFFCLGLGPQATAQQPTIGQWIQQYSADVRTLNHRFRIPLDREATHRKLQVTEQWLTQLASRDFDGLDRVGQTDYLLLRSELEYQLEKMKLDADRDEQASGFLPYADGIIAFCKTREDVEPIEASQVADDLSALAARVEKAASKVTPLDKTDESRSAGDTRTRALRAVELLQSLNRCVQESHQFYNGYDPEYSWWAKKPMQRLSRALESHRTLMREKIVGIEKDDKDTIVGLPIGEEGLEKELRHEWIAHQPDELIELAKREMAWCEEQMAQASDELGFGDDWRAAMERVKSKHVPPGQQPQMIRNLAWEAIRFLEANDLVTVPPLAANGWRMTMMSPERQRISPYFLGGETIIVSFPTDTMTHEEKRMSMRSNNEHFSRATVHHELIPGHHLQKYMLPRHKKYRAQFNTPFWMEGWALYWEMLLWDLDFARSAEDRIGMLFWRKHRCARIIFSLNYHLGKMRPDECIDYLVQRVGHERSAATAEVRRSIMGGYSPLYQAAYMLGGLQLRQMHRELVLSGKMTNREFHDAILHEHSIPIEVLRNYLTNQPLTPDMQPSWRFADLEK